MSSSVSSSSVRVVLGTMEFGRYTSESAAQSMVDYFLNAGHRELDTALMYSDGESEKILGRLPTNLKSRVAIHTKVNPWIDQDGMRGLGFDSVIKQAETSLSSLQFSPSPSQPPIDILYLHAPDHNTPIQETLKAMHTLHQRGVFKRLGLSNYSAWEVMEVYQLCHQSGYVLPTVYQGMYNALTRAVDEELMKCLSYLHIAFYAYNPLAGGILTGRYSYDNLPTEPGRYQGNAWAERYRQRYWRKPIFNAIDELKKQCDKDGVSLTSASLRWLMHHSTLKGEKGDAVIIGASKEEHVKQNIAACAEGPLSAEIVAAFDDAWKECKPTAPAYFR